METPQKLPGLTNKSEAELRQLYADELGQDAPDDLTTRQSLIDALKKHRNDSTDETPGTDLAALAGEGGTVTSDPASEIPGTSEETASVPESTIAQAIDHLSELVAEMTDEEVEQVLDVLHGEAFSRGLIRTDEDEVEEAQQDPVSQPATSGFSALSATDFQGVLTSALAEAGKRGITLTTAKGADKESDQEMLIAVKDGEERPFTRESWNIMAADRNGWVEKTEKAATPKDLD